MTEDLIGKLQTYAARIDTQAAEISALRNAIMLHIPVEYLKRHDAANATGPTSALNLKEAMRDYSEDRWELSSCLGRRATKIDRLTTLLTKASKFIGELKHTAKGEALLAELRAGLEVRP